VFKGLADFILFKNPAKISKEIIFLFKKAIKKSHVMNFYH
jgi:hypothetical protein